MAQLSAAERSRLPDSAFAYVDSKGNRRLPINDASHVRNALARFGQVAFESDEARQRARQRLLAAAKRHGIVPLGFIEAELRNERHQSAAARVVVEASKIGSVEDLETQLRAALGDESLSVLRRSGEEWIDATGATAILPRARGRVTRLDAHGRPAVAITHGAKTLRDPDLREAVEGAVRFVVERQRIDEEMAVRRSAPDRLPTGEVALLFADLEGSTELLTQLGDRYARVLDRFRRFSSQEARSRNGQVVDMTGDEVFLAFTDAASAVVTGIGIQMKMAKARWPEGLKVRTRIGIHAGPVTLTEAGYVGLTVNAASRIMSLGHGGQILVSRAVADRVGDTRFVGLGSYRLKGLGEPMEVFQVQADGLAESFPSLRS
ncbi:MAG: adenylate/guanylate cyclase domain-containing protein [Acidimicrobiia bacterium]